MNQDNKPWWDFFRETTHGFKRGFLAVDRLHATEKRTVIRIAPRVENKLAAPRPLVVVVNRRGDVLVYGHGYDGVKSKTRKAKR